MFSIFTTALLILPAQGVLRSLQSSTCLTDMNDVNQKINAGVREAQSLHTSWSLQPMSGGSMRWNNGGEWSAASKAKNAEMCAANNAKTCEYSMCVLQKVGSAQNILFMDTFALGCRPNTCSASSSWSSAISAAGDSIGPKAFFWNPKSDAITTACSADPSQCTFEFVACGTKTRFPYRSAQITLFHDDLEEATASTATQAPEEDSTQGFEKAAAKNTEQTTKNTGDNDTVVTATTTTTEETGTDLTTIAIAVGGVAGVAAIALVVIQMRNLKQDELMFQQYE